MSARRWTTEHGEDGLRDKFSVYKTSERTELVESGHRYHVYPPEDQLGSDGEFVLVLRPETDYAAWRALDEYVRWITPRAPQLAADIRTELIRIDDDNAT